MTGLTPTWVFLKTLIGGTAIEPLPAITEVGFGQYSFVYDPEASQEVSGQIDFGETVLVPYDRYWDFASYLSDSRTVVNLDKSVGSRASLVDVQAIPAPQMSVPPIDTATLAVQLASQLPAPVVNPTPVTVNPTPVTVTPTDVTVNQAAPVIDAATLGPIISELQAVGTALSSFAAASTAASELAALQTQYNTVLGRISSLANLLPTGNTSGTGVVPPGPVVVGN